MDQNNSLQCNEHFEITQKEEQVQNTPNKFPLNHEFFPLNNETVSDCALRTKRQRFFTSSNTSNSSKIRSTKKKILKKKSKKNSISNNEFNSFYKAFEQQSKTKEEYSILTTSEQSSSISMQGSPDFVPEKVENQFQNKLYSNRRKNKRFLKISSPQKNSQLRKIEGKDEDKKMTWPSLKITEIINSLQEIEKDLE